jgi:hypothetical protein
MNAPVVKGKFIKTSYIISAFENKLGMFDLRKPSIMMNKSVLTQETNGDEINDLDL